MRFRILTLALLGFLLIPIALPTSPPEASPAPSTPPVYVVLWFDTEDYILPQSDDAAKRLAEMLTRLGIKATFKVVGEKARVLERRGRTDVIRALLKHEIGYHANTHSGQPTIAVYLQHAGWDDGRAEFERREGPGVKDIQRIFGVTPTCYGQPGSAWAPQAYPALQRLGLRVYLDEGNHVGINDQPFYYGGMLNIFKMKSTVARMDLGGADHLARAKEKFRKAYDALRAQGGGTISIYYHPCEFIHREFWDGVNFARGKNPPRDQWRLPAMKSAAEIENAFNDFEQYVTFIKAQPGVRYVTANELLGLYADQALSKSFSLSDVRSLARSVQREITFQKLDTVVLSAADVLSLLTTALADYLEKRAWPSTISLKPLYGPAHPFIPAAGPARPSTAPWYAFAETVRDVASYARDHGRIPDEVWIGVQSLSPQDYLVTLASVVDSLMASGQPPDQVIVRQGTLTAEKYVAEDSPKLWGWVIFPEGFHAPKIMELARLQAWTLKPALLRR
jgi:hypothetical protein